LYLFRKCFLQKEYPIIFPACCSLSVLFLPCFMVITVSKNLNKSIEYFFSFF
jgi:hypothetical protein